MEIKTSFLVCFGFLVILISCRCDSLTIRRCCGPADRIDSLNNYICESNRNNVPFNFVNIKNNSIFSFVFKSCDKISKSFKGVKYEVSDDGISIFPENQIAQVYRDYCLDTDLQAGHETVILVCDNFIKVPKCCGLAEILEEESGKLICTNKSETVPTVDLPIPGNSNIIFQISNQTEFPTNRVIMDQMDSSISENKNFLVNGGEFCLDKLDSILIRIDLSNDENLTSVLTAVADVSFHYPLFVSFNIAGMFLVIVEFYRTSNAMEIKLCLISFLTIFLVEQIILITSYYLDLRELDIIKHSMTIFYFWILIGIWMLLVPAAQQAVLKKYWKILIVIADFELFFLLICFLKTDVEPIALSFAFLVICYMTSLNYKFRVYSKLPEAEPAKIFIKKLNFFTLVIGMQVLLNFLLHAIFQTQQIWEVQGIISCVFVYSLNFMYRKHEVPG